LSETAATTGNWKIETGKSKLENSGVETRNSKLETRNPKHENRIYGDLTFDMEFRLVKALPAMASARVAGPPAARADLVNEQLTQGARNRKLATGDFRFQISDQRRRRAKLSSKVYD
jgi:hypothetical protein